MQYEFEIFPTKIWGFVLNGEAYHTSDYVEYILQLEKTESSCKKSNLGGYQSRDNLYKEPLFKELVVNLTNIANATAKERIKTPICIDSMWANVNRHKDMNISHTHGGVLSGVFYVYVPKNSGNLIFFNPAVRAETSALVEKEYFITPTNCAFILFPSWLEHYVEPNMNEREPRISISFNFRSIYDQS